MKKYTEIGSYNNRQLKVEIQFKEMISFSKNVLKFLRYNRILNKKLFIQRKVMFIIKTVSNIWRYKGYQSEILIFDTPYDLLNKLLIKALTISILRVKDLQIK